MPIPRNWSEELVCEWLSLCGYSTEVGITVGKGLRGGRKEADVIGVKISAANEKAQIMQIYHVEIGQLGGHEKNVAMLKEKFSNTRTKIIEERFKKRMAFAGEVQYKKAYIDIWERRAAKRLMSEPDIAREGIEVLTPSNFYPRVFDEIEVWGNQTLPESYWMLKLLESLLAVKLLKS